ncbi:hypothetical protein GQ42DRAFT_43199 [Ramicandelaber brevisporus]|nr:hypothetical protein GQ42DRAFT_43199 [Ramicandelaber brevisporus]
MSKRELEEETAVVRAVKPRLTIAEGVPEAITTATATTTATAETATTPEQQQQQQQQQQMETKTKTTEATALTSTLPGSVNPPLHQQQQQGQQQQQQQEQDINADHIDTSDGFIIESEDEHLSGLGINNNSKSSITNNANNANNTNSTSTGNSVSVSPTTYPMAIITEGNEPNQLETISDQQLLENQSDAGETLISNTDDIDGDIDGDVNGSSDNLNKRSATKYPVVCEVAGCGMVLKYSTEYSYHQRDHQTEFKAKCGSQILHFIRPSINDPWNCPINNCNAKPFTYVRQLLKHINAVHSRKDPTTPNTTTTTTTTTNTSANNNNSSYIDNQQQQQQPMPLQQPQHSLQLSQHHNNNSSNHSSLYQLFNCNRHKHLTLHHKHHCRHNLSQWILTPARWSQLARVVHQRRQHTLSTLTLVESDVDIICQLAHLFAITVGLFRNA